MIRCNVLCKYMLLFIRQAGISGSNVKVRDLFEQQDIGVFSGSYSTPVNPSGVKFLKLSLAVWSELSWSELRTLTHDKPLQKLRLLQLFDFSVKYFVTQASHHIEYMYMYNGFEFNVHVCFNAIIMNLFKISSRIKYYSGYRNDKLAVDIKSINHKKKYHTSKKFVASCKTTN